MKTLTCDAILFDLDGVLVDSMVCIDRAWSAWADKHGLDVTDILSLSPGRTTLDTIRIIAPHLDAELEARLIEDAATEDTKGTVAMPGAAELIALLAPEQWAVVTSGTRRLATNRLRAAGLPLPEVFITAEDVRIGKPDPEGYLKGAQRLEVAPQRCIVIEDAPVGIKAAHAANMQAVGVATTLPAALLQEADVCIPRLTALNVVTSNHAESSLLIEVNIP